MKKLIWIISSLVVVFAGLVAFGYLYENKEEVKEKLENIPVSNNETYQFQDVESMEKAKTIEDAFDTFFGNERLFDEEIYFHVMTFPKNARIVEKPNGTAEVYLPSGTYNFKGKKITVEEETRLYNRVFISIEMKVGYDTRMEMIDFLHYIQHSGLTENPLGEPYDIQMSVYQSTKPGMNKPESHQRWGIFTEKVKVMDFSDKETMLDEIHLYGDFEGVNPSE